MCVSNLDFTLTNSDLHLLFSQFDCVARVTIFKDCNSRRSRGVAFILFVRREDVATPRPPRCTTRCSTGGRSLPPSPLAWRLRREDPVGGHNDEEDDGHAATLRRQGRGRPATLHLFTLRPRNCFSAKNELFFSPTSRLPTLCTRWALFWSHTYPFMRTMCGSRTGEWSLPCVMSD
jgi:hypothetical protein